MRIRLSNRTKNALKLVLKISVSAIAIVFVVKNIDLTQTWGIIKNADVKYLACALIVYAISQIINALRLNTLFARLPLVLNTYTNIRLYWLGMFYNFFLPGGIGGDGYKIYYLNKNYRATAKDLFMAVFSDRLNGLAIILCYLLLFSSIFVEELPVPYREYLFLLIPFVLGGYYLFVWIVKRPLVPAFWRVTLFSLLAQALQMLAATLVLFALAGTDCEVHKYMFLFLASSIASAIPVTLGGVGAREMAFLIGSTYLGTDEGIAVSLSVLFYVVSLISSVPGIYFAFRPSAIEK